MRMKILSKVKTRRGNRLAWWDQGADEKYWYQHFAHQIERHHWMVAVGHLPPIAKLLAHHLPEDGPILEAGCGTGWIVAALRYLGYEVEGVDYSEALIQKVLHHVPDLPVRVGDVCSLDVPDNYYSGYISLGVIEHRFEGCEPFLEEAQRVVAPGGILCISVPHFNLLRRIKSWLNLYAGDQPEELEFYQYGFTETYFRNVVENAGFRLLKFEYYGSRRCFQEEFQALNDILKKQRGLWRLPRLLNYLDRFGFMTHMVMAIAQKP